jgi:glycosyltransferase involved in cell wall biosynthesis
VTAVDYFSGICGAGIGFTSNSPEGNNGMIPDMFSIVVPTHNRARKLKRSLAHLLQLAEIDRCEVIVVNDGSTDGTVAVLEELRRSRPEILRVLTVANGGPGHARNRGVAVARCNRILFVDDDVFPRPGMIESHSRMLDAGYAGSQGLLPWHHEISQTPLLRYIDSSGSEFAFDQVEDASRLDFRHVYTGNFAVLRDEFLKVGGFDEGCFNRDLGFSAFEDSVLGYQLGQNGARLALNKEAVADHLRDMTEEEFLRKERKVGYIFGHLIEKYPAIARALGLRRKDVLVEPQIQLLQFVNAMPGVRYLTGYYWSLRLRHREAFYRGFLQFRQEHANQMTATSR